MYLAQITQVLSAPVCTIVTHTHTHTERDIHTETDEPMAIGEKADFPKAENHHLKSVEV